jgi:hypothetical protein
VFLLDEEMLIALAIATRQDVARAVLKPARSSG